MTSRRIGLALLPVASLVVAALGLRAQPAGLADQQGYVGLGLALRHLPSTASFMQIVAHPDDESNGLLVMLTRGLGVRSIVATATRGDGGQNEIGPELFDALSVLRTAELETMHRYDGAEQYYTRAVDFGYSFSIEETFEKWGKDEIVGDYVRLIRMTRPDVITTMRPEGSGGGQHHQASARIAAEAFRAAGDPSKYPQQIAEGLRPWQPKKLYFMEGFGGRGGAPPAGSRVIGIDSEVYDPLLGRTYAAIGSEERSNHKSQGMAQLLALPGPSVMQFRLGDTAPGLQADKDTSLFDGIDTTLRGLARYVGGPSPAALTAGLAAISEQADQATKLFESQGPAATLPALLSGLTSVRSLRSGLATMGLDEGARFEIDFRLKAKEAEFERAAVLAQGLRFDLLASDGLVVGGQGLNVTVGIANRGPAPIKVAKVSFEGLDGEPACAAADVKGGGVYRCPDRQQKPPPLRVSPGVHLTTPHWKRLPNAERYVFEPDVPFGAPFRPTPFRAHLDLVIGDTPVPVVLPVQYRYEGNIFSGEKRMDLKVVPAFSVRITPGIAIFPSSSVPTITKTSAGGQTQRAASTSREVRVSVTNGANGATSAQVSLVLPAGWRANPATAPVNFEREDEVETVRFDVAPAPATAPGQYKVQALVRAAGGQFTAGYQAIEYPHVQRHHLVEPAEALLEIIDVRVPPRLTVGYVMGVGDQVPPALEQLGARVEMLDADALAWGDLAHYDAIVTGVRAYERRADLRARNHRLLEYVQNGGTLIVQYNKFELNEAQYGPYPAKVSSSRVTDEHSPVQVLDPRHPVFTTPNRIDESAWQGWVQERGLYFLGEKDQRYVDLVQLEDPFEFNKGTKRGALVEARYGKGRWIYVGLGLWRQLPAGTPGAYRLFANLISLGRAGGR
jgi:LmbE family N-acetylglucosaminyl deacetylase